MMGELGTPRRECLERRLASAKAQTDKRKISLVLLADAEARQDQKDWSRLMKRHLEHIDRSDPNMCFKYAAYLSRKGAGSAYGVIRWADYALENKQKWSGNTYKKYVYGLYRLRAQAANKLWQTNTTRLFHPFEYKADVYRKRNIALLVRLKCTQPPETRPLIIRCATAVQFSINFRQFKGLCVPSVG